MIVAKARPIVRGALATAVLAAATLVGLSHASAAGLHVGGGRLWTETVGHPCPSSLTVTRSGSGTTSSSVVVTGTAPCAGRTLGIAVQSGATVRQGAATAEADGTTTVNLDGVYTATAVTGAAATVDGWNLSATWVPPTVLPLVSCRAINNPALTCYAALTQITSWGYPALTNYHATITVSSPSATADTEWQVTVNLADPAFPFVPVAIGHNNASELAPGWSCAQMPLLVVDGQSGSSTALVGGSKTVAFYFEGRTTGTGNLATCP